MKLAALLLMLAAPVFAQTSVAPKTTMSAKTTLIKAQALAGSLSCTPTSPGTASYNLTTIGTSGWAQWNGGSSTFETMSGGTNPSNNTGTTGTYYNSFNDTFSWTNGTPDTTGSNTGGIYVASLSGTLVFTTAAGTASHTAIAYYVEDTNTQPGATSTVLVHLSDSSAADYSYTFTNSTNGFLNLNVSCTYNAASNSQTATWTFTNTTSGTDIALQGVAYQ